MSCIIRLAMHLLCYIAFFFFNDTATTEIYTLSLHDALPIFGSAALSRPSRLTRSAMPSPSSPRPAAGASGDGAGGAGARSEEHTSELQSRQYLVCRLLLEKKKNVGATQRASLLLTGRLVRSR